MNNSLKVRHKIWLENENGEGILGDGKWELLKIISRTDSLKTAIEEMGWGYRSTWDKLKIIEERLGFKLIEKSRGGSGGGGQTQLTKEGTLIIEYFQQLHDETEELLKQPIEKFFLKIQKLNINEK